MLEFAFVIGEDVEEEEKESDSDEETDTKIVLPIYDVKPVEGLEMLLLAHNESSMEFNYWGTIRCLEGDPHGVGVAFCTSNRQHCYMGMWEKGQLKGMG